MGHVIDGKDSMPKTDFFLASPCIEFVLVLRVHAFLELFMFFLAKNILITHYLFSRCLSIYLCWDIVWGLFLDIFFEESKRTLYPLYPLYSIPHFLTPLHILSSQMSPSTRLLYDWIFDIT